MQAIESTVATTHNNESSTKSPLERFRSQRKSLSVTDMVSLAWCELQYFYVLSIHGKRQRTPAMKSGSKVHWVLEQQVHRTVSVQVTTREDGFALRLWNTIQGLRTLRATGLTREFEVWGMLKGQLVSGVIDMLTIEDPNAGQQVESLPKTLETEPEKMAAADTTLRVPFDPTSLARGAQIYVTDVKTRKNGKLPGLQVFRPTQYQLMFYHQLLKKLVTDPIPISTLTELYNLDPQRVLSDATLASLTAINSFDDSSNDSNSVPPRSQDTASSTDEFSHEVLAHNTLSLLWQHMLGELRLTFPLGAESLGQQLRAEYRSQAGDIIGIKTIDMQSEILDDYLNRKLQWWRGQREARGVSIHEAWKCSTCEYADQCTWRMERASTHKRRKA